MVVVKSCYNTDMTNNRPDDLYNIYTEIFPEYPMPRDVFYTALKPDSEFTHTIRAFDSDKTIGKPNEKTIGKPNDKTIGYALVCGNTITLLCVLSEYRGKGHGLYLLKEAENYIIANGYSTITLGFANNYIFQGVPIEYGSVSFFEKYGYSADETTTNLGLNLADFDPDKLDIPELPDDITFRFSTPLDDTDLHEAVEAVDPTWHRYFTGDPVMLAISNGKIVAFQKIGIHGSRFRSEGEKAGGIGCVGTIPGKQGLGIGRRMVLEGINWLKEQGCTSIMLTYVGIGWYDKLGFKPVSHQWMGTRRVS